MNEIVFKVASRNLFRPVLEWKATTHAQDSSGVVHFYTAFGRSKGLAYSNLRRMIPVSLRDQVQKIENNY